MIALAAVAMLLAAATTASAGAVRIMPLGDSITDGAAGSTDDTGYRRSLWLQLDAALDDSVKFKGSLTSGTPTDFDRDHEGHPGWHANQIRDNIYTWLDANPVEIVLLHIGTNDISGSQTAPSLKLEVDDILDNIDQWETDNTAEITVFVAQIINRSNPLDTKGLETSAYNDSLALLVASRVAAGDDLVLVDHESALDYPGDMDDTVHPNDAGYQDMADTWYAALEDFLLGVQVMGLNLTSTSGNGYSSDDLICQYTLAGDATTAATAWDVDGSHMMVAYLPMEGGATNALLDLSGNGNDGSTYGDPTWSATGGADGHGYYSFDGNDHIDLGEIMPTGAYTKTAWYRYDPGQSYNNIISGQSNHAFWVADYSGYRLTSGHNETWDQVEDPSLFPQNTWVFCAVTYDPAIDSGKLMLYRNGALVDSAAGISPISSDTRAYIGSYRGDCCWAQGDIDDARIYDFALSRQQLAAMYGRAGDGNTIVAEETAIGEQWTAVVTAFSDSEKGDAQTSNTMTIIDNQPYPPTITSTPVTEATVGRLYTYDVESTGDPAPTFSLNTYPTGMTVNSTSGLIEWTPAAGQEGTADVEVVASNTARASADTQSYQIGVAEEPPCPAGMVGYWKLDETSGTTYHDVYAGNDASCSSCPTPATGLVSGAQSFSASEDDGVDIPDDGSWDWGADDSFTVEYWMKTSSSTSGNRVLVGRDGGPTDLHWWIGCDNNGTVRFQLQDVNGNGQYIGGTGPTLNNGEWRHIVAVRDDAAGMNRIYVDAALVDSAAHDYNAGFAESVPTNLGYIDLSHNYNYDGLVDEVAHYDVAMSPSMIQEHYDNGLLGYAYCDTIPQAEDPDVENLVIASGSGDDLTTDDLTVSYDLAGSATTAATAWNVTGRAPLMSLYLPMEGGEPGALDDCSGNALTAVKGGDPTWSASAGFDGNGAYVFDGDDDLSVGENFPTGSSYTKTAWVYRTGSGSNGGNNIISGDENSGGHAFWAPDTYSNYLSAGHNAAWDSVQDSEALALDTWYFVAVTWDDATDKMMLYKNGSIVDSATVSADVTDATISIGSIGYSNGWMWEGTIDDARIYDRALSRQQIAAMYNAGSGDANTVVSQETSVGDEWYADVTPFSASDVGTTKTTGTLTIVDDAPPAGCPDGMTHFWKLDEVAGQPYEDYYAGNDAVCTDCPDTIAGTVGMAQWFDGTGNEVTVPDDDTFDWGATASFTVEFWMMTDQSTSGNRVIVGRDDAGSSLHWWIGPNDDGYATFQLRDDTGAGNHITAGPVLNDGEWHHIVATRDGPADMNRLFVDGEVADSLSFDYGSGFGGSVAMDIGHLNLGGRYRYEGALDEVALYDVALRGAEIAAHYAAGLLGYGYCDEPPVAPLITTSPGLSGTVGQPYSYDVDATGTPAPTYSLNTFPTGMTVGETTGEITWTPQEGDEGLNDVEVVATNVAGADTQAFQIDVAGASLPPCPGEMTHYWKLDDTSSPYEDYYAGNDATCTNCPDDTTGLVGRAQWFDGADDEVDVPDDDTFDWGASDDFTVQFWMYTSESTSGNRVIVGRDDGSTSLHWWIGPNGSGIATFQLRDTSGAGDAISGGPTLNNGEWHMITAVRDGAGDMNRLYVDGAKVDSLSYDYGNGFGGTVPINLGFLNLGGRYRYHGKLDEVALFDKALSPSEIFDYYDRGILGQGYCEIAQTAPLITSTAVTSGMVDTPYTYDVDATGYPAPSYALEVKPLGMSIEGTTGVITWTPGAGQVGLNDVEVAAWNASGSDTQTFQIDVAPLAVPEIENLVVTSTSGNDYDDDDLTASFDLAGTATASATAWYKDGSPNMVCYLPMEGGASNALLDYSGTGNDGVTSGDPAWLATGGFDGDGCFDFDGTGDKINVSGAMPQSAYTKTAWVNWDGTTGSNNIISGATKHAFWVTDYSGLRLAGGHNGAWDTVQDPTLFTQDVWTFVAITFDSSVDGGKLMLYRNGAVVDSATGVSAMSPADYEVNIGSYSSVAYFHGQIDEARVYDHALSRQQVAAMASDRAYDPNTIVAEETSVGDEWAAHVTPFSASEAGTTSVSNTVTIVAPETPPLITSTPVTEGQVDVPYAYDVEASGFPAPTYSLNTFPTGMEIVGATGVIAWTPTEGQEGLNDVVVVATNAAGADTQSFQIDVGEAPLCPYLMVGYWTFDTPGGPPYEDSFGDNDGTCTNCPDDVTGTVGGAVEFDGATDEMQIPDDGSFDWGKDDSFTVEFWMRADDPSPSENRVIVGRDGGPTSLHWWIGYQTNGQIRFNLNDVNGNGQYIGAVGPSVNDDAWHHMAFARDDAAGMNRLFLDGAVVDSAAHDYTAGFAESVPMNVGYLELASHHYRYPGIVDELAIYDRALRESEILAHYTDGLAGEGYCDEEPVAPLITSTPVTAGTVDQPYSYDVDATGLPAPTYLLNTHPSGMDIVEGTGVISWTPAAGQEGLNAVEVVATNSAGADTQSFDVDVAPHVLPDVDNLVLTSESGNDYTTDDLTASYDLAGSATTAATAWDVSGRAPLMTLYLPMEGAEPTALNDYSGSGVTVVKNGDPTWSATGGFDGNGAYVFDGDEDLSAGENFPTGSSYTKSAWVYRTDAGGSNIISGDTNTGGHAFWAPDTYSNHLSAGHNGTWNSVQDSEALALDTWYFVAVTWDDATDKMMLYKNGALIDSATVSNDVTDATISIGSFGYSNGHMWTGTIDDVRIYGRALSRQQIAAMYNAGTGDANTIVAEETLVGDTWVASVTPFSAAEAGTTRVSNALTIVSTEVPPLITSMPVTEGMENREYTYDVDATGYPAPTYSLSVFPAGMGIVPATGVITWTPTAGDIGLNDVEVVATNVAGADTQSFQIDVAEEPDCPAGITHYWEFEEAAQPYDDTWGDADATCSDCPTVTTGIVGDGKWFNGTSNEVDVPDDDTFDWGADDSFTIEFWMMTDESTSGNRVLIGRDDDSNDLHWWVGPDGSGIPSFQLRDSSGAGGMFSAGAALNDSTWHHFVAVRDGDADMNRLFVDGVKLDSLGYDYTSDFAGDVPINIGYINVGGRYRYHGAMDEVALYDRALHEPEIDEHYANGLAGYGYCDVPTAPDAPTMVAEPAYTAGLANTVEWSDEGGSGAAEYYAERATDDLFTENVEGSGWTASLSHEFMGLSDGQIYYYHVKATDGARGESEWSDAVSSTQDDSPPVTSCDDPGAYQNSLTFSLGYTADDATSGVQYVELWYQQDDGGYLQYLDGSPFAGGTISFTAPAAGKYDFYTVGTDNVDNVEDAPGAADCSTIVDITPPTVANVAITNETLASTDDFVKDGDAVQVTADVSDDDPTFGTANIAADLTGLGGGLAEVPGSYLGGVATWDVTSVTCSPQDGTVTVTVSATDPAGSPATPDADEITADNTPPTAVTAFDATAGDAVISLSWMNGADDNLEGVVVVRKSAGDYPDYDTFASAYPSIDSFFAAGPGDGDVVYDGTGAAAADTLTARDIYFYQGFCYDIVGHYGAADTTARDYATNYWLGDVSDVWGSWGYNGLVNDNDILKLSDSYGVVSPVLPDSECDVGPTVHPSGGRLGVPAPDDEVEYEDLMIFAMNYGQVSPGRMAAPILDGGDASSELTLSLEERQASQDGELAIALRLDGNVEEVKGVSVSLDPGPFQFVGASLAEMSAASVAPVFMWHKCEGGIVRVDLAVLGCGTTIGGSGDLVNLTFDLQGEAEGAGSVEFVLADVRGVDNRALPVRLEGHEPTDEKPVTFKLYQNVPNPFNPVTTLRYDVPQESHVTISVYDVAGRLVATLVDESVPAGRHHAIWNGADASGRQLGSGVYFYTMESDGFEGGGKMLLLK